MLSERTIRIRLGLFMWGAMTIALFLSEVKLYEYVVLTALWFSINALPDRSNHRSWRNAYLSFSGGYFVVIFGWLFAMMIWPTFLLPRLGRTGVYAIATGLLLSAFGELLTNVRTNQRETRGLEVTGAPKM